jgi:DNA-binding GntR family transcriptional regulator
MPAAARRPRVPRAAPARQPPQGSLDDARPRDHVSRAYEELRRIIVWGQLPPGSRISERIIADRLKLSRTPVRSALHRLEQEGFVASNGVGRERRLIVAPLTMHDGQEVFTIVGHLEGLAARTAAELPAPRRKALVVQLRAVNDLLATQAKKKDNATRFFDLDIEFHRLYVEEVVGPRLLTLHRAIKPQSERYIRLYVSVLLDQIATSVREHERIAASILRGDPGAAQQAVETNWRNAAERLTQIIAQHGERGSWRGWETDEG